MRQRPLVFWSILFPIILGTMFNLAFSGLSSDEQFKAIPTAVVLSDNSAASDSFKTVIESLSASEDNNLLDVQFTTDEEAHNLLKNKKIVGILYADEPVRLAVSSDTSSMKLEQSILNSFVEQYNMNSAAITNIAKEHPEKLTKVISAASTSGNYSTETSYSKGNMEEKLIYFFNLIAMLCLFSSMGGMYICINNQANLSTIGMRNNISPTPKGISFLCEILANIVFYSICTAISLLYLIFVLKIDFGNNFGFIALAAFIGCITGVSFGFFIGSFGKINEKTKTGLLMGIVMLSCFLSGLMVGNIQVIISHKAPWFNKINPAALITNSFYSLVVYESHERYFKNIITLIIISAIFYIVGVIITRRKKYANL